MEKIGLLAGVGTLPVEFAEAVRSQGYEVVCVAVIPGIDPRLKEIANVYYDISAFKLNKIIKTLVKENVKEVTMIGKVTKEWLYKDHVLPDLRAIKVLNRLRKANFKDDTITLAIVEELAKDGISVLDQTKYLKPLMPGPQVFTKKKPTEEQMADVAFGFKAAKAIGAMDLGQTVVVKNCAVMAVEAIEGTDACIRRAGTVCPAGGMVVVKVAKPRQDLRFDMPTIGVGTLESLAAAGAEVLAVEAGRTIVIEPETCATLASGYGVSVVGVSPGDATRSAVGS